VNRNDFPLYSDFQVVPNTFEAWKQAVETVILQIPEAERQKG
jgi:hypothetical protein